MSQEQYRVMRAGAGVRPRATRGVIAVRGADRADYLQGLLTNDIVALGSGEGCYAAYLTPQGRLVTDLEVLNVGDLILLDLDRSVTPMLATRLDEFVFTEDVTIDDWTDARTGYSIDGPSALTTAATALRGLGVGPDLMSDIRRLDEYQCRDMIVDGEPVVIARTDELGVLGVVLLVVPRLAQRVHEALVAAGAVEVDEQTAEIVRVESGRPAFLVDMDSDTIPLEAGIEDRAISLTKGCYVGQEVIIRILHRGEGRVARRLVGLTLDDGEEDDPAAMVPARGAALWHENEKIGRITSAVASPVLKKAIALGYVPRGLADAGTRVEVDVGGDRRWAVVTSTPFVSPGAADAR